MSYSVVPLSLERHRDGLFALWAANTYDPRANQGAMDRFAWLYESPAEGSHTWIALESIGDTVVGVCSIFRADRRVNGRLVRAGIVTLVVIDSKHRTGAAALAIQRALTAGSHEAGFDLVVIKPNNHRAAVFLRAGYRKVGVVRTWVRWLTARSAGETAGRRPSSRQEIASTADPRFDQLWETARIQDSIVSEKTAAYLNWRYSGFRENYRYYCLLHQDDDRLLGYVVFHRMGEGAVIADLLCADADGPILDDLLSGVSEMLRHEGCSWLSLAYLGHPSFEDRLRSLGFGLKNATKDRPLLAYTDTSLSAETVERLLEGHNWFFVGDQTSLLLADSVWRQGPQRGTPTEEPETVGSQL